MNWITKFSLKNTIAIIILTLLVVVSGVIATNKIKVETFPDVTFPVMTVQTVYPNASTEDVEENVTTPMEEALLNLEGYDSISSTSKENVSIITIMYPFGENIEEAQSDVESAVNKVTLPDDIDPNVQALSINSTPIYQAALSAEDLSKLQEDMETNIVPNLESIEGVSSVELTGKQDTNITIEVKEDEASSYGLSLSTIKDAIQQSEYKLPTGTLSQEGNSIPVEIKGNIDDLDAIREIEIPLTQGAGGAAGQGGPPQQGGNQQQQAPSGGSQSLGAQAAVPQSIVLSDIAEVKKDTTRTEISRFNGEDSILLEVIKSQEANTAAVADEVKSYLNDAVEENEYELYTVLDQGKEVNKSISALLKEGGFGALFTVVVILLFLRNIRATVIAILSLPISIFGTIALLEQFGYTLNIMTLGGLAVAVGRIVDDSIVVIENIYRWKQQYPEMKQRELVFKATKEVMGAIASSTIATIIVFLPLMFVSGILGEFFRPFSLAVVFSISISLIVAVMLIPVLGKFFFTNVTHKSGKVRGNSWYERFLRGSLKRKWIVFVSSIVLLFGSFSLVPALGVSFLPTEGSETFEVEMTLPKDVTLQDTSEVAEKIEEELSDEENINYNQVSIGFASQQQMPGTVANTNENVARFFIELKEDIPIDDAMPTYEQQIEEMAQDEYDEATVKATEIQQDGPPSGNSIDINLYSDNLDSLDRASTQIEKLLQEDDRVKNITNDMEDTKTKYQIVVNDEGEELNVSPFQLMQPIQERLHSVDGGTVTLEDKEWEMELTFDEQFNSKEDLQDFTVKTIEGEKRLEEIATINEVQVPAAIKHQDGETASTVSATIKGEDTAKISSEIQEDVDALSLPNDVEVDLSGGLEMITEGFSDLGLAMGAAVGLVFLVLSITFGGIITPIVILSSLIFVPVGSLAGLLIGGQTLSMSAMIGMLMLIGIVVTNAVVLLDRVEANRKEGIELTEAIVEASKTRLRPILMTALATIFALTPLALSNSASGLISKGLAITVIGGLTTSTLLTLIFVPVFYKALGKYRKIDTDHSI
ncbi:MMPL family transporter [Pontibacillus yanchengensis]|uniref:MMPL family transporter n=2 Tax=Pontibacillus yanchengensis TaxID=462910 RepID=A0ACC7VB02_9BACI|nr:efflux RND transporter permease subunit [Pontibacillus yanchengensis]MYL35105.1 MMPL family transporter [Pontibacillus yanchengensis]MYL52528.1 MMPL family transporter [Pontibacillus yanchengensis]